MDQRVVVLGPGDDCAVVRQVAGGRLLLTVDQVIEGRHVLPTTPIDLVARKAIARSVSDIAAMGGTPLWSLATACLPRGYRGADALFEACWRHAVAMNCPLVGGDIACAAEGTPLMLTVTVGGQPHATRQEVRRSDARAGDGVYVTGRIGGSLRSGRHLTFTPRVPEGAALAEKLSEHLHAMIDVSDGLGRDAGRIAEASGVRIELDAASVPLHVERTGDVLAAVGDGEDYELLFTAEPSAVDRMSWDTGLATITRIGRVVNGDGCVLVGLGAGAVDLRQCGWDHR